MIRPGWWTLATNTGNLRLYDTAGHGASVVGLNRTYNNSWVHLVATKSGPTENDISMYVNGIIQTVNRSGPWGGSRGNNPIYLGSNGGVWFGSSMDEIDIWNRYYRIRR